jgi:hypothetical protein
MLNAVLFVPARQDADRWLTVCAEYAARYRYQVAAVATEWDDVVTLVFSGEAQVIVVARRDHLPALRTPRLEIVTEVQTAPAAQRPARRPRRAQVRS